MSKQTKSLNFDIWLVFVLNLLISLYRKSCSCLCRWLWQCSMCILETSSTVISKHRTSCLIGWRDWSRSVTLASVRSCPQEQRRRAPLLVRHATCRQNFARAKRILQFLFVHVQSGLWQLHANVTSNDYEDITHNLEPIDLCTCKDYWPGTLKPFSSYCCVFWGTMCFLGVYRVKAYVVHGPWLINSLDTIRRVTSGRWAVFYMNWLAETVPLKLL